MALTLLCGRSTLRRGDRPRRPSVGRPRARLGPTGLGRIAQVIAASWASRCRSAIASSPAGSARTPTSELVYELDRPCERFEAWVGVDAEIGYTKAASVIFKVFGDGRELFNSGVMRSDTPAKHVERQSGRRRRVETRRHRRRRRQQQRPRRLGRAGPDLQARAGRSRQAGQVHASHRRN